jgi:hypothetical protein
MQTENHINDTGYQESKENERIYNQNIISELYKPKKKEIHYCSICGKQSCNGECQ